MDVNAIYGSQSALNNSNSFMMQRSMQEATSTLKEAGDSLKIAATTLTRGLSTGVQTGMAAYKKINPIVGNASQAWIPGRGEAYIQAPSMFSTIHGALGGSPPSVRSNSPYGVGSAALGAATAGESAFKGSLTGMSIAKGILDVGSAVSSILPLKGTSVMLAPLPFMVGSEMVDRAATRTKMASDIFRLSPSILPPGISGNVKGGFGMADSIKLSDSISKMATQMDDVTTKDLRAMNLQAMRGGWYDKTKNVKEFFSEFKNFVSTVKDTSGILDANMVETGRLLTKMRQLGVKGKQELIDVASTTQIYAERSGVNTMGLLSSSIGTARNLSLQSGIPLSQAIKMVAKNTTNSRLAYKSGAIGEIAYRQAGGAEGLGNMVSGIVGGFGSSGIGQAMLTRFAEMGEDGNLKLNEKNYKDFTRNDGKGISVSELLGRSSTISMSDYYVNKKFLPQLIKDNPRLLRSMLNSVIPKNMTANQKIMSVQSLLGINDPGIAKALISVMSMKDDPYMKGVNDLRKFQQRRRTASKEDQKHWYTGLKRGYNEFVEAGSDLITPGGYGMAVEYDDYAKGLTKITAGTRGALLKGYDPEKGASYENDREGPYLNKAIKRARQAYSQYKKGDGIDGNDYLGYGRKETGVDYRALHRGMYSFIKNTGGIIDMSGKSTRAYDRLSNAARIKMEQLLKMKDKDKQREAYDKISDPYMKTAIRYTAAKDMVYLETAAKSESQRDAESKRIKLAVDLGYKPDSPLVASLKYTVYKALRMDGAAINTIFHHQEGLWLEIQTSS